MGIETDSIRSHLKDIEESIAALNAERDEILTALKVLERYSSAKPDVAAKEVAAPQPQSRKRVRIKKDKPSDGAPRPDGIPTIWEMTELVFKEAGDHILHVDTIVERISKRWWPGVVKTQIAPTIYGFAREDDGRLERHGTGEFSLAGNENSDSAGSEEAKVGNADDISDLLNLQPSPTRQ